MQLSEMLLSCMILTLASSVFEQGRRDCPVSVLLAGRPCRLDAAAPQYLPLMTRSQHRSPLLHPPQGETAHQEPHGTARHSWYFGLSAALLAESDAVQCLPHIPLHYGIL